MSDYDFEWEFHDFIVDNDGYVNVWVDGSCLGNGQPGARAGYGIFYNYDHNMYVFIVILFKNIQIVIMFMRVNTNSLQIFFCAFLF